MLSRFKTAVGSVMDDLGTNKQLKQLHTAITKGNEDTAVDLYMDASNKVQTSSSSSSSGSKNKNNKEALTQTLEVNELFKLRGLNEETPMNLVSQYCMIKLCKMFLERGGNPNALNSAKQSCIHSLCSRPEAPHQRDELLKIFLGWEAAGLSDEQASLNTVDIEGNTAVHLAALNGLLDCVSRLVKSGAIISLVNNAQRTCCELADAGGHTDLASMLELALIFQPVDDAMSAFDESNSRVQQAQMPTYMLDCKSRGEGEVEQQLEAMVLATAEVIDESPARAEALLKACNWDNEETARVCSDYAEKCALFEKLQLKPPSLPGGQQQQQQQSGGNYNPSGGSNNPQQQQAGLKRAGGEGEEQGVGSGGGGGRCEICMVDFTGEITSHAAFLAQLRSSRQTQTQTAAAAAAAAADASVAHLSEEEQEHALECAAGHKFCLACWSQHCCTKISDNGFCELPCPAFQCGESLAREWAPVLLQPAEASKSGSMHVDLFPTVTSAAAAAAAAAGGPLNSYLRGRNRRFVDLNRACHYCAHSGCDRIVVVEARQSNRSDLNFGTQPPPQTIVCSSGHSSCLVCREEGHAPCSCDEYRTWTAAVEKEVKRLGGSSSGGGASDLADKMWLNANTKRCPRCSGYIEKDEGCNHMTCGNCKHDFCWMCMGPWREHTNATGGYFVCNRFTGGDSDSSSGSMTNSADYDDILGLQVSAAGEKGSSANEAKRQALANARMSRFIHFFTRFNAHSDSLQKETSKRNATFGRVLGNAERTGNGDLPWLRAEMPDENIAPTPTTTATSSSVPTTPTHTTATATATATGEVVMVVGGSGNKNDTGGGCGDGDDASLNPLMAGSICSGNRNRTTSTSSMGSKDNSAPPSAVMSTPPKPQEQGGGNYNPQQQTTPQHTPSSFFRKMGGAGSASGTPARTSGQSLFGSIFFGSVEKGSNRKRGNSKDFFGSSSSAAAASESEQRVLTQKQQQEEEKQQEQGNQLRYTSATSSLLFLREAFEELAKCRLFLRGSYAYGYFRFQDANTPLKRGQGGNAQIILMKRQLLAMEKCFTDAQGELEFSVELLSDVVARKRLRASQHDIRRSTLTARSKRIEMEDMLLGMAVAESSERAMAAAQEQDWQEERDILLARKRSGAGKGLRRSSTSSSSGGSGSGSGSGSARRLQQHIQQLRESVELVDPQLMLEAADTGGGGGGEYAYSSTQDYDMEALLESIQSNSSSSRAPPLPMAPTTVEQGIEGIQRANVSNKRRPQKRGGGGGGGGGGVVPPPAPVITTSTRGSSGSFRGATVTSGAVSVHASPVRLKREAGTGSCSDDDSSEFSSSSDDDGGDDGGDDDSDEEQSHRLQQLQLQNQAGGRSKYALNETAADREEAVGDGGNINDIGGIDFMAEEADYELHRAILASLNLAAAPGTGPTVVPTVATDGGGSSGNPQPGATPAALTPEELTERVGPLVEMMGCELERAKDALLQCGGNVESALDLLLREG